MPVSHCTHGVMPVSHCTHVRRRLCEGPLWLYRSAHTTPISLVLFLRPLFLSAASICAFSFWLTLCCVFFLPLFFLNIPMLAPMLASLALCLSSSLCPSVCYLLPLPPSPSVPSLSSRPLAFSLSLFLSLPGSLTRYDHLRRGRGIC